MMETMSVKDRKGRAMKAPLVLIAIAALLVGCESEPAATAAPAANVAVRGMAWTEQGPTWAQDKAMLQALGEQFDTSLALYEKLRADAAGGTKLTWAHMALPSYDWSGIYTRTKGGLHFDPDLRPNEGPVSAKLTPEGQKVVDEQSSR